MRTDREQFIEQVAGLIVEAPWRLEVDEIEAINRQGWTFEARLDSREYPTPESWTRVESVVLSVEELAAARQLVAEWEML